MSLNSLIKLCSLAGVSGDEGEVRGFLSGEIKGYGKLNTDKMGNLYLYKKGLEPTEKKLMVCAHMDEVGFIISHITEDGFLKFLPVGGIDERILPGSFVAVGKNRVRGCIGLQAVHLLSDEEKSRTTPVKELTIDIGARSKEDALRVVSEGDYAVFESNFVEFGDELIKSKALDDRVGCDILLELIKKPLRQDTYFVFTVQEEVGLYGAAVAAGTLRPDAAIIVETTTAFDIGSATDAEEICTVGGGPVISLVDGRTIYDKELTEFAIRTAEKKDIRWQTKRIIAGGNDAGAVQSAATGTKVLAVSVPCRYIHTGSCTVSKKDVLKTEELLTYLLNGVSL